jgi:hypothetical protein
MNTSEELEKTPDIQKSRDADFSKALFAQACQIKKKSVHIITDIPVEEIVDFKDKRDSEICTQMAQSYCTCVLTEEQLRSTDDQLGYEFMHSAEFFQEKLDLPGSQLLAILDSKTSVVQGAAVYNTDGRLPEELSPYAEEIANKLELKKALDNYRIGFVNTAWIDLNAREDNLYSPLTARMMEEMFEVHNLDYILAYYRVSPAENRAIKAHKHVGWEPLGIEFNVPLNPEKSVDKPVVDSNIDNSEREKILMQMGGLHRGILIYRREVWEQKGKAMLKAPHLFDCEEDRLIFLH